MAITYTAIAKSNKCQHGLNKPEEAIFIEQKGENTSPGIFWVSDRYHPVKIDIQGKIGNLIFIDTSQYYERIEGTDQKSLDRIRYYEAKTISCDTIWLRINEADQKFSKSLSLAITDDGSISYEISFKKIASAAGICFCNKSSILIPYIGKEVVILPQPAKGRKNSSRHSEKYKKNNKPETEFSIRDRIFLEKAVPSKNALNQIQLHLYSRNNAKIIWHELDDLYSISYAKNFKEVRNEYRKDIEANILRIGMNVFEIIRSRGFPDNIIDKKNDPFSFSNHINLQESFIDMRFSRRKSDRIVQPTENQALNAIWIYDEKHKYPGRITVKNGFLARTIAKNSDDIGEPPLEERFH